MFYLIKRRKLLQTLKKLTSSNLNERFASILKSIKFYKNEVAMIFELKSTDKSNISNFENEVKNIAQISGFKDDKISVITSSLAPTKPQITLKNLSDIKNIICVASCKGGVGKSTIAINLAKDYEEKGLKVGILDADIYGPSIPLMLDIQNYKPDILNSKLMPITKDNIKIFSMGFLVEQEKALMWRGSMVTKTIRNFFEEVKWGNLDVLIVDLPPGTGDIYLSLLTSYKITGALLVSSPHQVSLEELKKTINLFNHFKIKILGVVENMIENQDYSSNSDFKIDRKEMQKQGFVRLNTNFAEKIPLNL